MSGGDSKRLARAMRSLEGLSVGDAFGERFFGEEKSVLARIAAKTVPGGTWRWTDDTAMAVSIVDTLAAVSRIDPDYLASRFAKRYSLDPARGYGGGAHKILSGICAGQHWKSASLDAFDGVGSWGNGGAMRAAPIGAWFADDPAKAASEASASAEITHAHPEGIAGAVSVAVAAALISASGRLPAVPSERKHYFSKILDLVVNGKTRQGIERAMIMESASTREAAAVLGSGREVAAWDTVPFCLWITARGHGNFAEAMWETVSALGDRDTTCAIVGGIVCLAQGMQPDANWISVREQLPEC